MRLNDDKIFLFLAFTLLLVMGVASLWERFRPTAPSRHTVQVLTSGDPGDEVWRNLPPGEWDRKHAFYHLHGIPHGHPTDAEQNKEAEARWYEEQQRLQKLEAERKGRPAENWP